MPYTYKKKDGKYTVYKKDTGKKVGTTGGSKEALRKYLAALHIHADESCTYFKTFQQFVNESSNQDRDFEYNGYQVEMKFNSKHVAPGGAPMYMCSVYKDGQYKMGLKGPVTYEMGAKDAKYFIDGTIAKANENSPGLNVNDVKIGDTVNMFGSFVKVVDITDRVEDNIISFVARMPDGQEITFKYDDGLDDYVVV